MRKTFHKLHLWLSIPFGLIISVICLSGAMLVFENEIMELIHPERYYVERVEEKTMPVGKLLREVSAILPDSVSITSVAISSDPSRAYQVGLSKPRRAAAYIDQYTGEVKGHAARAPFFTFMLRLHRWLLDGMKPGGGMSVGKTIVGVSTLLFVFVLLTGIVIWVPRTRKALKNRLSISVKRGPHRFWYDLHVAGGVYAAVILLALALTGLTWSFSWYRTGFYKVFGVETQQQQGGHGAQGGQGSEARQGDTRSGRQQEGTGGSERRGGGKPSGDGERGSREGRGDEENRERGDRQRGPYANWQKVYEELRDRNPGYKQITLGNNTASVSFARMGNQRAADRYTFDSSSGEITDVSLYKDQEKSGKMRGWIYSVHVGNWGGLTTKILTFLAALLGGILPLTGYYLWIKKGINKRNRRKARAGAVPA